jgi:hypothetical protein
VELTIQTAHSAFDYVNRVLYDGQTNEVLASAWQRAEAIGHGVRQAA